MRSAMLPSIIMLQPFVAIKRQTGSDPAGEECLRNIRYLQVRISDADMEPATLWLQKKFQKNNYIKQLY
ncbi:hypothetical protein D0S45_07190 [Marinifilum sp. JC120]|nr:hypothetical protein D0S45_07190 [Marinifilum sp. JC120]